MGTKTRKALRPGQKDTKTAKIKRGRGGEEGKTGRELKNQKRS